MLRWCNVVMLRYVVDVEVVIGGEMLRYVEVVIDVVDVVMLRCCDVEICCYP